MITDKAKASDLLKSSITGATIKNFSSELRDNFDIVMEAVNIHGNTLRYASERLTNNQDIVRQAVGKTTLSFKYAGPEIKKNREFILSILEGNVREGNSLAGGIFQYCDRSLQEDRSFALEFIKKNAFGLKHFPLEFKGDREIALTALDREAFAFKYIKKSLRDEIEITKKALSNPYNLYYIATKYKKDEDMVLFALKNTDGREDFSPLEEIGDNLKSNKDFFIKLLKKSGSFFKYASDELKQDCDLLKLALDKMGSKIDYPYSNSKELLAPLIKKNAAYLSFAPEEVKNDRGIMLGVLEKTPYHIHYASEEIRNMIGDKPNEYVAKLKKIISIEGLADKLDKGLDEKNVSSKMKI